MREIKLQKVAVVSCRVMIKQLQNQMTFFFDKRQNQMLNYMSKKKSNGKLLWSENNKIIDIGYFFTSIAIESKIKKNGFTIFFHRLFFLVL